MDETWVTKICFWARFELYMREENDIQTSWQKFLIFEANVNAETASSFGATWKIYNFKNSL